MSARPYSQTIVFFDGHCGLCSGVVDFLMVRDQKKQLLFSPLQGETARQHLAQADRENLDTVIVMTDLGTANQKSYRKSAAVLEALKTLGGFYAALATISRVAPEFLRNQVYDFVAKNRFRFIERRETCRLPTAEERSRFLP